MDDVFLDEIVDGGLRQVPGRVVLEEATGDASDLEARFLAAIADTMT